MRDYVRHAAARSTVERETKEKDGVFTGRYAVNPVNGESIPIWVADYVLMELRHRRDHGRAGARRARPRVRGALRPRDPAGRRAGGRRAASTDDGAYVAHTEDEVLVNSGEFDRPAGARGEARDRRVARPSADSARRRSATGSATGCSRASATGAARSRSSTATRCGIVAVPDDELPVLLPEIDDYLPKGTLAARGGRGLGRDDVPALRRARRSARPTRWTRSSTRPGTSSATRTPRNDEAAVRPADRRLLAARQAVHRRHRARRAAPALRAVLHEGAERPGAARLPRAVLATVHAGDDLPARREDVEDEGQRRRARRGDRTLRRRRAAALHPLHGPGRARTWSGTTPASRASRGCSTGSGASGSRSPPAAPVDAPATASSYAPPTGRSTKVTDDIVRRFPFHTPIAALIELVNEIYRVKDDPARAGEVRFATETVRLADPAVRAARRRGALGASRRVTALGAALAGGRPGARRRRDGRDRRPGERQAARPAERAGGHARGRARGAGARVRAGARRT